MWKFGRQLRHLSKLRKCRQVSRRFLLSPAYSLKDVWEDRWPTQIPSIKFNELSMKMIENFEEYGKSSLLDMKLLALTLTNITQTNIVLAEDLIYRFRHSSDAFPVQSSIIDCVVRSYIDIGLAERLLPLIKDKLGYGLLIDFYTANLLMDHFIQNSMIKEAASVAYEMMLQEDFTNQLTNLLSLYSCVKRLREVAHIEPEEDAPPPEEEEEEWVRVDIVHRPVYDDHFDITNENFLLGKSLYYFGKENCITENSPEKDITCRSLQFVGLGLYHKFHKALDLLDKWMLTEQDGQAILTKKEFQTFKDHLEWSPVRDPDEPPLKLGQRTLETEQKLQRLTQLQKDECTVRLQALEQKLKDSDHFSDLDVESYVVDFVVRTVPQTENADLPQQRELYKTWKNNLIDLYHKENQILEREKKLKEIEMTLVEMAEKEELLTAHERKRALLLAKQRAPKEKVVKVAKELDEDELEELQQAKFKKSIIKRKK